MGRKDVRLSLLTCDAVRDRLYPLLLRTLPARQRGEVLEHVASCVACCLTVQAVSARLERIEGVPPSDIGERRQERGSKPRRRFGLFLLALAPALLAYAFLIHQGLQLARYRHEQRVLDRLSRALLLYREDFGTFPPGGATPLSVPLSTQERGGPYLDLVAERVDAAGHVVDAWGGRYRYTFPGRHNPRLFDLQSLGTNGRDDRGRKDDLANW